MVLPNGDLYVQDINPNDKGRTYTCRTLHRVTGVSKSSKPARIIIAGPCCRQ